MPTIPLRNLALRISELPFRCAGQRKWSDRSIGAYARKADKPRRYWLIALLASLSLLLFGCHSTPPEQALRNTIAAMQAAGEQHKTSGVMDSVADDFAGPDGMDRKQMQRFLLGISLQNRKLGTTIGPLDIKVIGDRATVNFTLGASGGEGGWLPDRAQVYQVETGWRMEGSDWKLISANWKEKL
jgi:hypothetical protein